MLSTGTTGEVALSSVGRRSEESSRSVHCAKLPSQPARTVRCIPRARAGSILLHALSSYEVCFQGASKDRKKFVHVNYHTDASRCEQAESLSRNPIVSRHNGNSGCDHSDNKVKEFSSFEGSFPKAAERSPSNVPYFASKSNTASFTRGEIIFSFPVGGFNQNRRKVHANCGLSLEAMSAQNQHQMHRFIPPPHPNSSMRIPPRPVGTEK